jgi:hypothetical protein
VKALRSCLAAFVLVSICIAAVPTSRFTGDQRKPRVSGNATILPAPARDDAVEAAAIRVPDLSVAIAAEPTVMPPTVMPAAVSSQTSAVVRQRSARSSAAKSPIKAVYGAAPSAAVSWINGPDARCGGRPDSIHCQHPVPSSLRAAKDTQPIRRR